MYSANHKLWLVTAFMMVSACRGPDCVAGPPELLGVSSQFLEAYGFEEGEIAVGDDEIVVRLQYDGVSVEVLGGELVSSQLGFPDCFWATSVMPTEVTLQGAAIEPEALQLAWGPEPDWTPSESGRLTVVWTPLSSRNSEATADGCGRLEFPMHHTESGVQITSVCVPFVR